MNVNLDINVIFSAYDQVFCTKNQRIKDPLNKCRYDPKLIQNSINVELINDVGWKIINDFNPELIGWINSHSLATESHRWSRINLYRNIDLHEPQTSMVSIDRFTINDHYGLIISYHDLQIVLTKSIDSDLISFLSYIEFAKGPLDVSICLNEFYKYIIKDYFKIKFKDD